MDDVLSHDEVKSLLSVMETASEEEPEKEQSPPPEVPVPADNPREKVIPYDFKRPERVGKEQMRALQSLHEGFGRNYGAALSALLRTIVEVKLTSVDQLTYSEFVFSLENPTCFNLLRAEPLEGHLILDLSPTILFPIIDRLLGGGKGATPIARRPLTEIELRLVSRITSIFLVELKTAWENVMELTIDVERVESNPQLVQIVPPNEVVVLISFEVTLGDVRGMMNLCIPFNAIERYSSKLSANNWVGYSRVGADPETSDQVSRRLNQAKVELVVTLANSMISTADLLALRVGDIITTDKDVHTPLHVSVEGVTKFLAGPGALKGRKAIEVVSNSE
jgi:flagellar motor switch protein FliM